MEETEIYPIIGEEGFTRLVAAFYRQVPHDDILGAMYPRDELQDDVVPSTKFTQKPILGFRTKW